MIIRKKLWNPVVLNMLRQYLNPKQLLIQQNIVRINHKEQLRYQFSSKVIFQSQPQSKIVTQLQIAPLLKQVSVQYISNQRYQNSNKKKLSQILTNNQKIQIQYLRQIFQTININSLFTKSFQSANIFEQLTDLKQLLQSQMQQIDHKLLQQAQMFRTKLYFYKALIYFLSHLKSQFQSLQSFQSHTLKEKQQNLLSQNHILLSQNHSQNLFQGDIFKKCFINFNPSFMNLKTSDQKQVQNFEKQVQSSYNQVQRSYNKVQSSSKQVHTAYNQVQRSQNSVYSSWVYDLLNPKQYESNYVLKVRLIIKILGVIKLSYQQYILSSHDNNIFSPLNQQIPLLSLNNFLSSKILSPVIYLDLLKKFYQQFDEKHIQNQLISNIGQYSPEIVDFNKELIDLKIRQHQWNFQFQQQLQLFYLNAQQIIYDRQTLLDIQAQTIKDSSTKHIKKDSSDQYLDKNVYTQQHTEKESSTQHIDFSSQHMNKDSPEQNIGIDPLIQHIGKNSRTEHIENRQFFQKHSKLILSQIAKHKQTLQQLKKGGDKYKQSLFVKGLIKSDINKLFPHCYYNITDFTKMQLIIQKYIIPVVLTSNEAYEKQIPIQIILRQIQKNTIFFNRFLEYPLFYFIQTVSFIQNYISHQSNKIIEIFKNHQYKILKNHQQESSKDHQQQRQYLYNKQEQLWIINNLKRVINIIYYIIYHVNSFQNQQYWHNRDHLSKVINQFIKHQLKLKLNLTIIQIIQYIKILSKRQNQIKKKPNSSQSIIIFRILSVFIEMNVINYQELFQYLLNPKYNNSYTFLYYSDGLQRVIRQLVHFQQKNNTQYHLMMHQKIYFKQFVNKINNYQSKFNNMLTQLHQINNYEFQLSKQPIQNCKNESDYDLRQLLKKYNIIYENDLLVKRLDEQLFIQELSQTYLTSQSNLASKQLREFGVSIRQQFSNRHNILLVLSQNINFLSSTICLSYQSYLQQQIEALTSFQKFSLKWNYPFNCDISLQKQFYGKRHRLYIKFMTFNGIKARNRLFIDQTNLNRNFMGFNPTQLLTTLKKLPVENFIIGIQHFISKGLPNYTDSISQIDQIYYQDKQVKVTQIRVKLNKANVLIRFIKKWLNNEK